MKRLRPFSYFEPTALQEAIEIAIGRGSETYFLAGGTDLYVRMKRDLIRPSCLINLKRIKGLNRIEVKPEEGLRIGALARISEIERSPLVYSSHPVLQQAAGTVGSPSIRNLATIGGNIGRASPASDLIPSLMVLGTRVSVEGSQGKKELDLQQLFLGPGKTALLPSEVITSFFVPETAPFTQATYLKLGRVEGMDCALVGVAALLTLSGKTIEAKEAKVALASVGPVPLRAKKAEEILLSGPLTEERIKKASRAAADDSSPISDMRASSSYRKEMVRVLTFRALSKALRLAQGEKQSENQD
jgi:carbon-monoxide dehydrogenase medium subunit